MGSEADRQRLLVLEVTPNCNNACQHCYNYWRGDKPQAGLQQPLSAAAIGALMARLSQEADVGYVALSGGEPFLRPDLPEIVRSLTDLGIQTTIITNGTLIQVGTLRRLPAETVFEVTLFSTDPTTHDTIAGRACFQRVVDNINLLDRRKRPFIIACVMTKRNLGATGNTIRLGVALGARAVMLNRVNLTRQTLAIADQLLPSTSELEEGFGEADRVAGQYGVTVAASVPVPPCVVEISSFRHIDFGWCPRGGPKSYYTVSWDGTLRPCNHSSLILGDLKNSSFQSLTGSKTCQEYWAPVPPECQSCQHPLRDQCRGGCPAAAYECFGSAHRLDPFVELRGKRAGRDGTRAFAGPFSRATGSAAPTAVNGMSDYVES